MAVYIKCILAPKVIIHVAHFIAALCFYADFSNDMMDAKSTKVYESVTVLLDPPAGHG
jgi:hypothetical protein